MAGIYRKYATISAEKFEKGEYSQTELIESYIPVVLRIAGRFPAKWIEPSEARSIGLLELTRTIQTCQIRSQQQLTKLIMTNVNNRIKEYCVKYYRKSVIRSKSRKIEPTVTRQLSKKYEQAYYKWSFEIDLRDTVNKIVSSPIEGVIMDMIMEGGYTLEEIAKEVGYSRAWVGMLKDRLLRRLKCELQK